MNQSGLRVLVVGGTGFVSGAVVRCAEAAGHEVFLFNRGQSGAPREEPTLRGDASELSAHRQTLRALRPDAVVHAVCNTEHHARELVSTFEGTDTRLVVLSSADRYQAFQSVVHERDDFDVPIDGAARAAEKRFYWRGLGVHKDDDYDKNDVTQFVLGATHAGRVLATALHITMVYGPRDHQFAHRHGPIIRRIIDGRSRLVLGCAEQSRLFTYGYIDNIAAAAADATLDVRLLPDALLSEDASADAPSPHLIFDCSHFAERTGFQPPVSLEQGIAHTLTWARSHPECLGDMPDYDAEDRLVTRYDAALSDLLHPDSRPSAAAR